MALSSGATSRIVDAIATDMAQHSLNPLKNKVFHASADIRIQSIEDESKHGETYSRPLGNESAEPTCVPSFEDVVYQEKAERMKSWWGESIAKNMNQPDGYSKVAVLLIKWADELDELSTGREARELESLFRDRFHYETRTVELNVRTKSQFQLDCHVGDFIRDYDGPHNLLIVYYTGHGVYREDKRYLELTASINPALVTGLRKDARANWNKAEDKLKDEEVEGDVLTILDTCYSSNHVKSGKEQTRKFELLSACPIDQTTASPGDNSFTRALIDAIQGLLKADGDRPISTWSLYQRINIDKRRDTPAQLWDRFQTSQQTQQHILLAPLKRAKVDAMQSSAFWVTPKGFLTLRFGLRDASLNEQQIQFMTKTLAKAFDNKALVGLKRIDWVDIRPAPPISHFERVARVMFVISQWRKFVKRRIEERESQTQSQKRVDVVSFPDVMEANSAEASQKRPHEGEGDLPDTKRLHLDASQPPSPPVSHSSRIEYDA